jgi:feruloyl esterase
MVNVSSLRPFAFACCACVSAASWGASCPELGQLSNDAITIAASEYRNDSTLEQRVGPDISLVRHCRVAATLHPRAEASIGMELWMPVAWNGKFLALGNGGWAGSISFAAMARGLSEGYAVASNDTGHEGGSAEFAVGNPEKLVDFAWRAMHEMTLISKQIIERFYERQAELSYFQGCSTGGRQGLKAAQMFPGDFDGIIVGAPVNNMLALNATQLDTMIRFIDNPELALSREKVELLHNAVMAECEVNDGIADGFLSDPLACGFDPGSLQCSSRRETEGCLTRDEVRN